MSRSKKSSSAKSSEDSLCQDIGRRPTTRRTSQSSSTRQTVYPNVPRRVRPLPLIDDEELIDTESTIDILPSRSFSQNVYDPSSNRNAYNRHTLDLLTKYTSPKKQSQQTSSPPTDDENSLLNDFDFIYGSKSKRTLSPLNETSQRMSQSKRTKAFIEEDDDEEENELSCFLDHRYAKRVPSQTTNQIEQKQPTKRKPTARNLNTNRSQTSLSQAVSIDIPVDDIRIESCEPMIDHEEINFVDRIDTSCLPKPTAMSTSRNRLITTPIDIQNKLTVSSTPIRSIKQISLNPTDRFSPSTNSLFFDTPNSSFSRLQINRTTSTPQIVSKTDCATEIIFPTNIDMIKQLITQTNSTSNSIDINPNELAKQLFNQTISFSTMNKHQYIDLLPKKQLLYINRYEIEIIYPLENEKFSSIYVCDTCLKNFYGSSIAYQRHAAKCLSIQPPGKLIYTKDDLAIFQIGQTNVTFQQRIYMKFLYRLSRLFIDKEKAIDDTKLNSFIYYILCRKDTILSAIQPPVYRFIGYFSKQVNQSAQQMLNNFSCLFILPCLPRANEYNRFLISFSYLLNRCSNLVYSSPVRPLDNRTFSILQNYWREIFFNYLIHHNHSSIKPLALDAFARQTSIHPRDILLSLSTHDLLRSNPTDKSSIYLRVNAYSSMTHSNLDMKNEILFMDTNSIDINDEKKMISNESNTNKSHDSGIEEIVLD